MQSEVRTDRRMEIPGKGVTHFSACVQARCARQCRAAAWKTGRKRAEATRLCAFRFRVPLHRKVRPAPSVCGRSAGRASGATLSASPCARQVASGPRLFDSASRSIEKSGPHLPARAFGGSRQWRDAFRLTLPMAFADAGGSAAQARGNRGGLAEATRLCASCARQVASGPKHPVLCVRRVAPVARRCPPHPASPSASRYFSASRAAMQPKPADVIA